MVEVKEIEEDEVPIVSDVVVTKDIVRPMKEVEDKQETNALKRRRNEI
jgi:hypothetical protein